MSVAAICVLIGLGRTAAPQAHAKGPRPEQARELRPIDETQAHLSSQSIRWHLVDSCTDGDCLFRHITLGDYTPQPPVVATPAGSTYSVTHGIFGDPDGPGPEPEKCNLIFNPLLPGAPDDVVRWDGVPEAIRTDLFGTVPTIQETAVTNNDDTFQLVIDTFAPPGTDLFPDRLVDSQGMPLRDICYTIGLDDPLNWAGADFVLAALFELRKDGQRILGPINITDLANPWDGFLSVVVEQAAGLGANQVRLEILISKDVPPPVNDDCEDAIPLPNGTSAITNVGATTDGAPEPQCDVGGTDQIASDVWYEYTASCTGDLQLDLCGSFFDTKVAVYNGCGICPPTSDPIVCVDDTDGCGTFGDQSRLTVPVAQGQCYRVRIGGFFGDQGPGTIRVSCNRGACCNEGECSDNLTRTVCENGGGEWSSGVSCSEVVCRGVAPPNDECANCAELTTGVVYEGTTNEAGGSQVSGCGGGADVADTWHCWTADCTGVVQFDLCDSAFDTTMAIYDGCGGEELNCNDDACGLNARRSLIERAVEEGTTYYVRVSGFAEAVGDYNLLVTDCQPPSGACCLATQQCFPLQTEDNCLKFNGTYLGDGTTCLADMNGNLRDDACETCLNVPIADATPASGTVDARAPQSTDEGSPNWGIGSPGELGSPAEPIVVELEADLIGAEGCFEICETIVDAEKGPNAISSVTNMLLGRYQIILDRPITPGGVTTIRYTGDGSWVEYTAHPGNVNADDTSDVNDIVALIDCCLLGQCEPAWGVQSCDIDHSGTWTPSDILMVIDVLNGAGALNPALNTLIPDNEGSCP